MGKLGEKVKKLAFNYLKRELINVCVHLLSNSTRVDTFAILAGLLGRTLTVTAALNTLI